MPNPNNANNPKNAKNPGKKLDAATAQKMRQQMADQVDQLSDDELAQVAGGATPITYYCPTAWCIPSPAGPIPGPPSPGAGGATGN